MICGTVRLLENALVGAVAQIEKMGAPDRYGSASDACRHRPGRRGLDQAVYAFASSLRS